MARIQLLFDLGSRWMRGAAGLSDAAWTSWKACARERINHPGGTCRRFWVQLVEHEWPEESGGIDAAAKPTAAVADPNVVKQLRAIFGSGTESMRVRPDEAFRSNLSRSALIGGNRTSMGTAIHYAEILVGRPKVGNVAAARSAGELVHAVRWWRRLLE